jgi:phosphohistidine phosphatase
MREHGIRPGQVLCSPSRRTRETLEGIAVEGELLIEPELYSAGVELITERLKQVPDEVDSVMVIGHNPAMQLLVLRLAGATTDGNPHPSSDPNVEAVQRKFPTAALATLSFEGPWRTLGPGRARLAGLVRPKDLH